MPPKSPAVPAVSVWMRVAQILAGLFYAGASYFKYHDSFFGDYPLINALNYWLSLNLPIQGYRQMLTTLLPYSNTLALGVILLQGTAGLLLIYHKNTRAAGIILLLVQMNIFLATFHSRSFNLVVGVSLWAGLYCILRPSMGVQLWTILTIILMGLLLGAFNFPYLVGSPWLAHVAFQRSDFAHHTMSVTPAVKYVVLMATRGAAGTVLWASMWWIHLVLVLLLCTRWRLAAGSLLLCLLLGRSIIFLNKVTSEGAQWVIIVFLWVTHEHALQHELGRPVRWYGWIAPLMDTVKGICVRITS